MDVKIVIVTGRSALVEYEESGMLHRCIISAKYIEDFEGQIGSVPSDIIRETGTPYGVDWGLVADPDDVMGIIVDTLRRHGIWTVEDLHHNSRQVSGALQQASSVIHNLLVKSSKGLR